MTQKAPFTHASSGGVQGIGELPPPVTAPVAIAHVMRAARSGVGVPDLEIPLIDEPIWRASWRPGRVAGLNFDALDQRPSACNNGGAYQRFMSQLSVNGFSMLEGV